MAEFQWSAEQEAIFQWFERGTVAGTPAKNLLVRARAGTGKTTTIVEGVNRAPDKAILLCAFNKAIAVELENRVRNPRVQCKTLHALGAKFCFRNWAGIKIDDAGKRKTFLAKQALSGLNAPDNVVKLVAELHTKAREIAPFSKTGEELDWIAGRFHLLPDDGMDRDGWTVRAVCDAAYRAMKLARERTVNGVKVEAIDFADMIYLPLVNNWTARLFNCVVIDEAQDMTAAQLTLAQRVAFTDGRIAPVGDDKQAIYEFRGASSESLDHLKDELQAAELPLKITRRCGKRIVELAQTLVPDFAVAPSAPDGHVDTVAKEAMVQQAREGDFVLSRTNAPLIKVALAFLKAGKRARIKGKDIGRGIQGLLRKLDPASPRELPALLAGWAQIETARARASLAPEIADERVEFIADQVEILTDLATDCETVSDLRQRIELLFDDSAERGAIMCSSVHRSKGLEADNVFALEGTFKKGSGEEANIRYVAITRARARLAWVKGFERAPRAA